jgi:hypothetical protein
MDEQEQRTTCRWGEESGSHGWNEILTVVLARPRPALPPNASRGGCNPEHSNREPELRGKSDFASHNEGYLSCENSEGSPCRWVHPD